MNYRTFIFILTQLRERVKAECIVQGSVIFIESKEKNTTWNLSTKIIDGENEKDLLLFSKNMTTSNLVPLDSHGTVLRMDKNTRSVYLEQKVHNSGKYLPFRSAFSDFTSKAVEWKQVFEQSPYHGDISDHIE